MLKDSEASEEDAEDLGTGDFENNGKVADFVDEEYRQNLVTETKELRSRLAKFDDELILETKETLRDFFKRTGKMWVEKFVKELKAKAENSETIAKYQEKELRREGFKRCEERFYALSDVLERLDELEEE